MWARTFPRWHYPLREDAFADPLTSDAAYWVGFLMADGNVQHPSIGAPRVRLCLSERDEDHVRRFRQFLDAHTQVQHEGKAGRSRGFVRVHASSHQLIYDLERHGVVPKKTRRTAAGPLKFNRDFWRGVLDGDGCLGIYWNRDPRYRAGGRWAARLNLAGNEQLLADFLTFVRAIRPHNIHVTAGHHVQQVQLSSATARVVVRSLYEGASTYLPRKMTLARRIWEGNN